MQNKILDETEYWIDFVLNLLGLAGVMAVLLIIGILASGCMPEWTWR